MARSFTFELITPEGLKHEAQVYQVLLPTEQGMIGILPGHQHLLTILTPGVISIFPHAGAAQESAEHLATLGGFAEVSGKRVRVLADAAERAEEIDEVKAQEALTRAKLLRTQAKDQVALGEAVGMIERESARLKVAGLKRRKR